MRDRLSLCPATSRRAGTGAMEHHRRKVKGRTESGDLCMKVRASVLQRIVHADAGTRTPCARAHFWMQS
jgi:hypothetical protein